LKRQRITFVVGVLLVFDSAQAGPPFVTDDPEPPPPGGWEINVPFILGRTSGRTEMDSPLFDLNYGLPSVQLKLEIPIAVVHDDGDGTRAGAGDLLIGVKWRFLNNEQSKFQLGVYPQLLLPTGGSHARTRRGSVCVRVAAACTEKLGEMDALRQRWFLVANG
jgi:Putative MetA-pathway of phenol degradation